MNHVLIAYIPVVHQGYLTFISHHPEITDVYLFGKQHIESERELVKDIRGLQPHQAAKVMSALFPEKKWIVLTPEIITELEAEPAHVIFPDEAVCHNFAEQHFTQPQHEIEYESIFLRWDNKNAIAEQAVRPDEIVSKQQNHRGLMNVALSLAQKSSDWWRQVGALIVRDEKVLIDAYNEHVPFAQITNFEGDPRASFHKGDHIEVTTAFHAEAWAIAQAAERGISLRGAELYVTTFPCPNCAKLIAYTGISTIYYAEGYSMLDGERILRDKNIRIIRVIA